MMSPIAHYLVDFSPSSTTIALDLDIESFPSLDGVADAPAHAADLELRLAEARQEGAHEGREAAEAAAAEQLAELAAEHARQIEAERQAWADQQGEALALLLRTGLSDIETGLATTLADLLGPILKTAIRARAIDDARQALASLLAGQEGTLVRVSGPADLVDALQSAFANEAVLEIEISEAPDVTIRAGETTIQTHLEAWAASLQTTIEDAG